MNARSNPKPSTAGKATKRARAAASTARRQRPTAPPEVVARVDLWRAGLLDAPAIPKLDDADLYGPDSGYSVIQIPPGLFDADVRRFVQAIVRSVYRMEPPRNPLMRAVYRMLARLEGEGIETSPEAVGVGLLLAAAKVHRIAIKTHPRDLAAEIGCRYATLLAVRRAAIAELSPAGVMELSGNLS